MREPAVQAIPLRGPNSAQAPVEHPPQRGAPVDVSAVVIAGQGLLLVFSIVSTLASRATAMPLDSSLLVLSGLLAAAQCAWTAWNTREDAASARGFGLLAASLLVWAAADYRYWLLAEYRAGVAPLTHGLYFSGYALTVAGLLSFPSAGPVSPARLALDAATVTLGGAMAISYLVLDPLSRLVGEDWTAAAVILPYSTGDLLVLLASALLALRPLRREARPAFRWLVLAQLVSFVVGLVYAVEAIVVEGFVTTKGYMLVQLMTAYAAFRYRRAALVAPAGPHAAEPLTPLPEPGMRALPYAAIALGFASLVYAAARGEAGLLLPVVLAALLTAAVVGRQALAVRQEVQLGIEREARLVEDRERRRADAERERLLADLEAKNAELERFNYAVSHDLKSPLLTIRGFVDQVRTALGEGRRERVLSDLDRIASAAAQMQRLLAELLELSRVGRVVNPPQTLSLGVLAEQAASLARARLAGVEVVLQPELPDVHGDPVRLLQVLQNLLENAGQFRDGRHPRVEIGARTDAGSTVLFVRDNGIGIDPRHHERVFGLFHKLDPRGPGSGIGLALARRIVEAHGGRMWVESEGAGKGSTFCFTLAARP